MSGGKGSGKQRRDTAAEDALLQLQALHHPHREAPRQGATDAQIAYALGKASRISLILLLFKTVALANCLRGLAQRNKRC
jgi:hypothetical protein